MAKYIHLTNFEGKLYRYQPYSDKYIEYVNDLILNNKIYYSKPLQFNDPFDCKLYGIEFSEDSIKAYIIEEVNKKSDIYRRIIPSCELDEIIKRVTKNRLQKAKDDCYLVLKDLHKTIENEIGVLCLSSDPLNILMYSHYADKHKGICLEFTLDKDNIFNPEPVRYREDYPLLKFGTGHEVILELAVALIATKSKAWEYEKEYRSLKQKGAGVIDIPDHYLSGIIFGCEAEDDTIRTLINIVNRTSKNIKFYRAIKSNSSFSLTKEEL